MSVFSTNLWDDFSMSFSGYETATHACTRSEAERCDLNLCAAPKQVLSENIPHTTHALAAVPGGGSLC